MPLDIIWTAVALILTLMVFSYVLGDNFLFRLAIYIFVGAASGWAGALAVHQVILPRLILPLLNGSLLERGLALIPMVGSILLLFRLSPGLSRLGNLPVAYIVGAGAGVITGGAVLGTLVGLFNATLAPFSPESSASILFEGVFVLLGTAASLAYFSFGASAKGDRIPRRAPFFESLAQIGSVFIAITLGAVFAGVYTAALTALLERFDFIRSAILSFLG